MRKFRVPFGRYGCNKDIAMLITAAFQDLQSSVRRTPLWAHLGWSEVLLRYRRTTLGPWWITLSMMIFIVMLSLVYGRILHQEIKMYLAFLFTGYVFWSFISSCLNESADIFFSAGNYLQQIKLPYFIFVFKTFYKNLLLLIHNLAIYPLILLFCYKQVHICFMMLLIIPGFILLSLTVLSVSVIIALLGARYRDIPPIVSSLLQIVFFISPITWMSSLLGDQTSVVKFNPMNYLLMIVREPLLGTAPSMLAWDVSFGIAFVTGFVALMLFSKFCDRIPFWSV